jgi:hypothetical protein
MLLPKVVLLVWCIWYGNADNIPGAQKNLRSLRVDDIQTMNVFPTSIPTLGSFAFTTFPTSIVLPEPTVEPTIEPSAEPSLLPTEEPTPLPTPTSLLPKHSQIYAGSASYLDDLAATTAILESPGVLWMNSKGDYYVADKLGTVIHYVYSTYNRPKMQKFAGYTGSLFYTDGSSALNTPFGRVSSIWGDTNGNLFVVDNFLNLIRKISNNTQHTVTTIIGTYSGSNTTTPIATERVLNVPFGITGDTVGNLYYTENSRISKYDPITKRVTDIVGDGMTCSYGGSYIPTDFAYICGGGVITMDSVGALYFFDRSNALIRKIYTDTMFIHDVAGIQGDSSWVDNYGVQANSTWVSTVNGLFVETNGNIYFTESLTILKKIDSSGIISRVAGDTSNFNHSDSIPALDYGFYQLFGVTGDTNGNLYVTDSSSSSNKVQKISKSTGKIDRVAGGRVYSVLNNEKTPADEAQFYSLWGITGDTLGNIYVSNYWFVHKITEEDGLVTTVGGGFLGWGGDGNYFNNTGLPGLTGLFMDSNGDLFVGISASILKVDRATQIVEAIIGVGNQQGYTAGGQLGKDTMLSGPADIYGDTNGFLYVADELNHAIRLYNPITKIVTDLNAPSGSNMPSSPSIFFNETYIDKPQSVYVDTNGTLYITDDYNMKVLKVDSQGIISDFAGNGGYGSCGEYVPATSCSLAYPKGVRGDSNGNIYFVDRFNYKVNVVFTANDGQNYVSTAIGSGSSDGESVLMQSSKSPMNRPGYLYVNTLGNFFVTEETAVRQAFRLYEPSSQPTSSPTDQPVAYPTGLPTVLPSSLPSSQPSGLPTGFPTSFPSGRPSGLPTCQPSFQPISRPTSQPSALPSVLPSSQPSRAPSNQPNARPTSFPSFQPSAQPVSMPTMVPSSQPSGVPTRQPSSRPSLQPFARPTSRPSCQPSSMPSSMPTLPPTRNRFNCKKDSDKSEYFFPDDNACYECTSPSFVANKGDFTCICPAGYKTAGFAKSVNCTACDDGYISSAGNTTCSACPPGYYTEDNTVCKPCQIAFYNPSEGQGACIPCPGGRSTAVQAATLLDQCLSPLPNMIFGIMSLSLVVVVFSWYIVMGKFHRASFERKVKTVLPNVERCKELIYYQEIEHQLHLIEQRKKQENRPPMTVLRKLLIFVGGTSILVVIFMMINYTIIFYRISYTALILYRGLRFNFHLESIFTTLERAFKDISFSLRLPDNMLYALGYPFIGFFDWIQSLNISMDSVSVTCAGSQAPMELLLDCFIIGILIIIIRSDYQLLFNILLINANNKYMLNNIQKYIIDDFSLAFPKYFYYCIVISVINYGNPFQAILRYAMGITNAANFVKNNHAAHLVTQTCDGIAGAAKFDSSLGYMSSVFAWWLVIPTLFCLADVVVHRTIHNPAEVNKIKHLNRPRKIMNKINPYDLQAAMEDDDEEDNEEDAEQEEENEEVREIKHALHELQTGKVDPNVIAGQLLEDLFTSEQEVADPESQLPKNDETTPIGSLKKKSDLSSSEQNSSKGLLAVKSKPARRASSLHKKKTPAKKWKQNFFACLLFLHFIYEYLKGMFVYLISVDRWLSSFFSYWIRSFHDEIQIMKKQVLKIEKNNDKIKNGELLTESEKKLNLKELNKSGSRRGSSGFLTADHIAFSLTELKRQTEKTKEEMDDLWERDQQLGMLVRQGSTAGLDVLSTTTRFPSYYTVCKEEWEEFVYRYHIPGPIAFVLVFLSIGHPTTQIGRYYWKIALNNYKIFLFALLGIWTDECVQAYDLEALCNAFISYYRQNKQKEVEIENIKRHLSREKMKLKKEKSKEEQQQQQQGESNKSSSEKKTNEHMPVVAVPIVDEVSVDKKEKNAEDEGMDDEEDELIDIQPPEPDIGNVLSNLICVLVGSRALLLMIVPSLVFFSTYCIIMAGSPLVVLNQYLKDNLDAFLVVGEENRKSALEDEMRFLNYKSEADQQLLISKYSWRLKIRGWIAFWNDSRLLQFVNNSLMMLLPLMFLIYSPNVLNIILILLGSILPFVMTQSFIFLLYFGKAVDLTDDDLSKIVRGQIFATSTSSDGPMPLPKKGKKVYCEGDMEKELRAKYGPPPSVATPPPRPMEIEMKTQYPQKLEEDDDVENQFRSSPKEDKELNENDDNNIENTRNDLELHDYHEEDQAEDNLISPRSNESIDPLELLAANDAYFIPVDRDEEEDEEQEEECFTYQDK